MIMNILVCIMLVSLVVGTIKMRNHSSKHHNGDEAIVQFQKSVNKYLRENKK